MTNVLPKQFVTVAEHQTPSPASVRVTSVARSPAGEVGLAVAGGSGFRYLFEASSDLAQWSRLGVRTNLTGSIRFIDYSATNLLKRFYRVSIP